MHSTLDRCKVFADAAKDLALQPDLPRTAQRLVAVSVRLTGCDVAALWEPRLGGHAVLRACSDAQFGRAVEEVADEVDDGPMRQRSVTEPLARYPISGPRSAGRGMSRLCRTVGCPSEPC